MNRMQEWLARAAGELSVAIAVGYVVILPDGREIVSQALFPTLGASLGTLVFTREQDVDSDARQQIENLGFTMSTFGAPADGEVFDIDGYAEMFADWGWTGDETAKPAWMNDARWSKSN